MEEQDNIKYRQMYFDLDGNIKQETYVYHRTMTPEKQDEYDKMVADSNQMSIFDFINQNINEEQS